MTQQFFHPVMPNLNDVIDAAKGAGGRGLGYSRMKQIWTESVWAHAKSARLKPMVGLVTFTFEWREPGKKRDPDNVAAGGRKFILDGLVKAGVLPSDGWRAVGGWTDAFSVVKAYPGVFVTMSCP